MITFLHTSGVHIGRFEKLVRLFDQHVAIKHIVNSELLDYALEKKQLNLSGFEEEIDTIKKDKPDLIICTCSSYGSACNDDNEVKRIDLPIADYLVSKYTKIGVAYTATSTKEVSCDLLQQVAKAKKKEIEIIPFDCTNTWQHFKNNDINKYEKKIASKLKKLAPNVETIFLAQASMEGAKKYLKNINQTVFSSPEFGIKSYLTNYKTE